MANGIPPSLSLEQIKAQLGKLDEADEAIKRAETAGLDVKSQKAAARETRQRLLKLRQAYFPGQA